jgi:hypothetical protein
MNDARFFIMSHPTARERALECVRSAPEGHEVSVKPPTRNSTMNALLHAEIGEVAETIEWAGKKRSIEVWKRLLVAAWLRARGESIEVLPALDGHGVDLVYAPTSQLSQSECSELVSFIQAWKAEQG